MRIAVVHTGASACRCHAAFREALRALGHRVVVVPCERLTRAAVAGADLVFEHCDTFRGRHELRPLVRFRLELWGCRIVGTPAAPAAVADDKRRAHRALARAGVPAPKWEDLRGAAKLGWPRVVKRALAHGSDRVRIVRSDAELGGLRGGPWMVEEFVAGQELALAGYEERGRIRWLPLVAVDVPAEGIYSHAMKWGRRNPVKRVAKVPAQVAARIRRYAARAWRALGLRGYARFDLRLAPDGRVVFLEANVRPSVEPAGELLVAAAAEGMDLAALLRAWISEASRSLASTKATRRK